MSDEATPGIGAADQAALLKELEKIQGEEESPTVGGPRRSAEERSAAQALAARLGLEYVDLRDFQIDHGLFRAIPVDLMFRYNFVPCAKAGTGSWRWWSPTPTDVLMIDELELSSSAVAWSIEIWSGPQTAIQEILKKSESSQRVLDEATENS